MIISQSFVADSQKAIGSQVPVNQFGSIFSKLYISLTHQQEGHNFLIKVDEPGVISRFKKMFAFTHLSKECRVIITSFYLRFVK